MSSNKKENMNKGASSMSLEEKRSFMRPLGFPGLPYPMARLEKNDKGLSDHSVGAVHSAQNPLIVYSAQSAERVNGQLFRSMPTPSMMFMLRDMLTRMAPESDNCLMTIFGDASAGKTFMFYQLGDLVHPQGALKVDCGGMNMHELFFRTVIDYGQGVKEQLDNHGAQGRLQKSTIEFLNGAFPGSVVENDGKASIDWELIGRPNKEEEESWTNASQRTKAVLELVYSKQGINVQTNSFGIKTVPGEVFEAWESGRPLILDEFNKSKRGTLDTFQTFLQFLNGEKGFESFTAHNPLAESSDSGDCPKSITLHRKDRKLGWFAGIAGNDATDGDTTQELSVSMLTRLNPLRIGSPQLRDWEHRLSQIYTGLPVTTLYNLFGDTAKSNPTEFGQWLVDMRKLGLDENEIKAIAPHEIHLLQNFQDTIPAMEKLAQYYNQRLQLSDPESALHQKGKMADVADEVAAHGDRIHVSFRKAIADFNKALISAPEVVENKGLKLDFNIASLFKDFDASGIANVKPGWYSLGANVARVIQEDIANDTIDMDKTHAALIKICEDVGVMKAKFSGAKANKDFKTVSDLLKYEEADYLGGSEALMDIRKVLIAAMKSKYKGLKGNDETIIPLASLNRALVTIKGDHEGDDINIGDERFVLPNEDVQSVTATPILHAFTNTTYFPQEEDAAAVEGKLLDYRMVLAGFALPGYGEANRVNIWPADLREKIDFEEGTAEEEKEDPEVANTLMGTSEIGLDLAFLEVADSKGKAAYLSVLEDKRDLVVAGENRLMLVIGAEEISPQLQGELAKAHITYLKESDEAFRDKVNEFIGESARFRAVNKKLQYEDAEKVTVRLIRAFAAVCALEYGANDNDELPIGTSFVDALQKADKSQKPQCYTSILKNKRLGKAPA